MINHNAGKLELTAEEADFQKLSRSVYNSGRMKEAYDLAAEFYAKNPGSLFGKFVYAGMAGDYSEDASLPEARKKELLETAKKLVREVYEDEKAGRYEFYGHVRNEYFWFFQLNEEQYGLGEELVANGQPRGYYSMCVGASAMAKKSLLEQNDPKAARAWAAKSVTAFREFEKVDPDWYNVNYFYAYALAVLGYEDAALHVFKDKYLNRKAGETGKELEEFQLNLEKMKVQE
jgi:hypothetical protein